MDLDRSSVTITSVRPIICKVGVENPGARTTSLRGSRGLNPATEIQYSLEREIREG